MADFIDARTDFDGEEVEGSIAIIGAGAAGITLARELSKANREVILIESGGLELEGDTQALYAGQNLGLPYFNLAACRLRYFGGTTNHWAGYCRANDEVDYMERPEVGLPGWPITHDDLAPYVARAATSLGIADDFFDPAKLIADKGFAVDDLGERQSPILETKVAQIAEDIRLGKNHRDELQANPNVRIFLHANATNINLVPSGNAVDHIAIRTLNGRSFRVRAKRFIIACHAIENARLLLSSNDVAKEGIGNASDHVGRHFMDHIYITASRFYPSASFPKLYDRMVLRKERLNANLGFTDKELQKSGLLQYYLRFIPRFLSETNRSSFENVQAGFFEPGSLQYLRDLAAVATDPIGALKLAYSKRSPGRFVPDHYDLEHRIEQAPNADCRVVLSENTDVLGSRIADLDFKISDYDIDTLARAQELMAREVSALGWGRFQLETIDRSLVESRFLGHYHNIGTTRMASDPTNGVCNSDSQVFGVDNLYMAGSSLFPSAGYSGPTMMLIALSLRLADHIGRVEA
ncbi:FAD-dependent oxidoreductase [Qipengyuania sp. 902]|uniref:FAD-dependent oxidoreductase n=1 Tax=Qipengyuania sp. 902 TaxID=3417565 RepID=UPI003EBC675B